jgi:alcohol dehydrogenase class IV
MHFEFATATRIIFGAGCLRETGELASELGATRALVVTGHNTNRAAPLYALLEERHIEHAVFPVSGEPTTETARLGTQKARAEECDLIIGFGGGSALDTGKAIAALLTNGGEPLDYLEVIGKGKPITTPSAPYIAIPTTAGTGTEVTRNAVLKSTEHQVKVSLRSPLLLPRVAVIDPELTYSLPPEITATTGLDAFTQVLEPFVSNKANPLTDAICREGLQRAARSLQRAYEDSENVEAREDMAIVSLFGGLALANAKLGAAHGFAGPAGGMFPAPHGTICARVLPYVIETNVHALQCREPENMALQRYDEIAGILTGNPNAVAADGVAWVQELCETLNIPPLSQFGMSADDIPVLVQKAGKSSSMKGNPILLSAEELQSILERAL